MSEYIRHLSLKLIVISGTFLVIFACVRFLRANILSRNLTSSLAMLYVVFPMSLHCPHFFHNYSKTTVSSKSSHGRPFSTALILLEVSQVAPYRKAADVKTYKVLERIYLSCMKITATRLLYYLLSDCHKNNIVILTQWWPWTSSLYLKILIIFGFQGR